jgi:hypothetical protein
MKNLSRRLLAQQLRRRAAFLQGVVAQWLKMKDKSK